MVSDNNRVQLMTAERIERSLKRMALEILEDSGEVEDLVIGGIRERGAILATRIGEYIREVENCQVRIFPIPGESGFESVEQAWSDNSYLILVDDVIFTGRTMFRALQMIAGIQLPRIICSAVLIDRGHRRLPVYPKYSGLHIPTKFNEHIKVQLSDGGNNAVWLEMN